MPAHAPLTDTFADPRYGSAATLRNVTLKLCAFYWFATFVTDSITWGIAGVDPVKTAAGKVAVSAIGGLMCLGISAFLFRMRRAPLWQSALVSFLAALAAAPVLTVIAFLICGIQVWPIIWGEFGRTIVSCQANFFGWSCLFVALLYSFETRAQEQRLAITREEALAAQMRALRYQINPHFLFNTLNSIASLIGEGQPERAERMVLSLSEFLHETLRRDPTHDLRLDEELSLQAAYLEVERERFPGRIAVKIEAPDDIRGLPVPSLILQPLIENAVKHGVHATSAMIEIDIRAWVEDDRLTLQIENDVPPRRPGDRPLHGFGIGLRNVAERIRARFGDAGEFIAGPVNERRFRAALTIPVHSG